MRTQSLNKDTACSAEKRQCMVTTGYICAMVVLESRLPKFLH